MAYPSTNRPSHKVESTNALRCHRTSNKKFEEKKKSRHRVPRRLIFVTLFAKKRCTRTPPENPRTLLPRLLLQHHAISADQSAAACQVSRLFDPTSMKCASVREILASTRMEPRTAGFSAMIRSVKRDPMSQRQAKHVLQLEQNQAVLQERQADRGHRRR